MQQDSQLCLSEMAVLSRTEILPWISRVLLMQLLTGFIALGSNPETGAPVHTLTNVRITSMLRLVTDNCHCSLLSTLRINIVSQ